MSDGTIDKLFLKAITGSRTENIPFWLMRQAGRYLPEYRELRVKAGDFLSMAYDPELASEITLQPIRRFGMDAAIIFSDILVVPNALGQKLEFVAGEGPKLDRIENQIDLAKLDLDQTDGIFEKVYEAIAQTRSKLDEENFNQTALIGFAGAPWTVSCYMIEGQGSKNFDTVKKWAYADEDGFSKLLDILVQSTVCYLIGQIKAGAEALQIFDSWSGLLDEQDFERWVIRPTQKIIQAIKVDYPDIPIIGFPRGAGVLYQNYAQDSGVDALSLDQYLPSDWAAQSLQKQKAVQGNLDPVALLMGGDVLKEKATKILDDFSDGPFVFNLGHGVIKETPPAHVEQLTKIIRDYSL